jgi:hypothetical protein
MLPQLTDQARQSLSPDPHLQCVLLDVDPLNEQLDNARLLGDYRDPPAGEAQRCSEGTRAMLTSSIKART